MAKKVGRPKGSKNRTTKQKELSAALSRIKSLDMSEFKGRRGRPRLKPVGTTKKVSGRGPGRPKGSKNKTSKYSPSSSATSGQRVIIVGRIKLK